MLVSTRNNLQFCLCNQCNHARGKLNHHVISCKSVNRIDIIEQNTTNTLHHFIFSLQYCSVISLSKGQYVPNWSQPSVLDGSATPEPETVPEPGTKFPIGETTGFIVFLNKAARIGFVRGNSNVLYYFCRMHLSRKAFFFTKNQVHRQVFNVHDCVEEYHSNGTRFYF